MCVCPPDSKISTLCFTIDAYLCSCIILCYFTGIFYAVIRQITVLFTDNKDSVFCIHQLLINPAKRLLSTWWYTEEHSEASVYWHTVRGCSHRPQWQNAVQSTRTKVYNCAKEHRMRLMQLFPLNCRSHGMRLTHMFVWGVLQGHLLQRTVQCDSFGTVEDAVLHWPKLDVCRLGLARNLNSRRLRCWKYIGGGKIRRPSQSGRKGRSAGLCCPVGGKAALTRQMMFSLFTAATLLCYAFPQVYKRQEENVSQLPRNSTRQWRQPNHSFVTENIETTASVS